MKVFIAVAVLFVGLGIEQASGKPKRDVLAFGLMISHATGRSAFDYLEYGCFCGLGGAGTPVDDIDRCCQVHDNCYDSVGGIPHLTVFDWEPEDDGEIDCKNRRGSYKRDVCECDREAALCFASLPYPGKQGC